MPSPPLRAGLLGAVMQGRSSPERRSTGSRGAQQEELEALIGIHVRPAKAAWEVQPEIAPFDAPLAVQKLEEYAWYNDIR